MRRILLTLFFLSGFTALIYQVVWLRMLELVFGVTSFAVATILSAFMAGLALGSFLGGKFIDKRRKPLAVFACLQIGIAVAALLFPAFLSGLTRLYVLIYRQWATSFYVLSLMRFAVVFLFLLVPTTLMGATLPVLAKFFVRSRNELGADVGSLYSVNNWGAVLGVLTTGFVLIETVGVKWSGLLAAAISIAIGLVTLYLHKRAAQVPSAKSASESPLTETSEGVQYPKYIFHIVLWVFAIEGFTSLGYEVVWTRILASSMVIMSVYTYSIVVATFIAGLAIGSFLVRRLVDKRVDLLTILAGIEIGIGLSALFLLPLFHVTESALHTERIPTNWGGSLMLTSLWVAALMLVPTILMGATLPVVSKIYVVNFRELGRRMGVIGCLDTVGSVFGAFATGFVLIQFLGMQKSVLVLAAINLLLGILVVSAHPAMRPARKAAWVSALLMVACAGYMFVPRDVRFLLPIFARGNVATGQGHHILYYNEGSDATVVVAERFFPVEKIIAVNGHGVAGTGRHLETTQILQGHLPLLLYEAQNGKTPRSALTIGLGSGGTSGTLSLHDLEQIHCVELSPGVLQAAKQCFKRVNRNVFADPRYHVFIEDGRTYVLSAERKYDVILTESIHPAYPGNASLYSADYFRYCKARLADDGIISVWIPLYWLSSDDLKMICKSFSEVFPHATLWRGNNGHNKHAQLIATQGPLSIDFDVFRRELRRPRIRQDLARLDLENVFTLLNCHWLDERAFREYCKDAKVNSDDHPYLAYSAPRSCMREPVWINRLSELFDIRTPVLPYVRFSGVGDDEIARCRKMLATEFDVVGRLTQGFALLSIGEFGDAMLKAEEARKLNPGDKTCTFLLSKIKWEMAKRQLAAGDLDMALQTARNLVASDPDFALGYRILCRVHGLRGELDQAIEAGEEARKRSPEDMTLRYQLAMLYAKRGQVEEARARLRALLEELPGDRIVERALAGL